MGSSFAVPMEISGPNLKQSAFSGVCIIVNAIVL